MKKVLIFLTVALAACHQKQISPYQILKVFKTAQMPVVDVRIKSRLNQQQLLEISAKIKSDSTKYGAFKVNYLLDGTIDKYPDVSDVYATAEYAENGSAKNFPFKDADGNVVNIEIFGLSADKAKHLLTFSPPDSVGKSIIGKFVDDYTKTVSIVYLDSKEPGQTFILEMDTTAKVVSATAPMKFKQNGLEKLVVSQAGDYLTIKDSIMTMYSSDDPEHPFRSVKAGL